MIAGFFFSLGLCKFFLCLFAVDRNLRMVRGNGQKKPVDVRLVFKTTRFFLAVSVLDDEKCA